MNRKKPELLAPAGNLSCAISAYKSGADAVYCGLDRFNAREGADNFSFEDLSRLAAYAKSNKKNYYITLNTLLKENEIDAALGDVGRVAPLEPDAIIVQDLGLLSAINETFPSIPLHASTQMGIHNSAGLSQAAELGIDRVILERQIDIEELRGMATSSPVELEVFIHGALCCSISGMCLFSSWMGGWSGNRGRCKQPCRRRFHTTGKEKKSGFFFSTQDLYSVELIQEYIRIGIASLKIEGRLKKEEYIEHVVRAYRMILDEAELEIEGEPNNDITAELKGRAKQELSKSYGRKWSQGFATAQDRASLIVPSSPGISGLLVGDVLTVRGKMISVRLSRPVKKGDRLRIQDASGGEASAFRLLTMKKGNRPVGMAFPGDLITIIPEEHLFLSTGEAGKQLKLFKVGESSKSAIRDSSSLPLFQSSIDVDIRVRIDNDGLTVSSLGQDFQWTPRMEEAQKKSLDKEMVEELFSATRDPRYRLGRCETLINGSWFIPPGELKQIRREFWNKIVELLPALEEGERGTEDLPIPEDPRQAEQLSPQQDLRPRAIKENPIRGKDLRPLEVAGTGDQAFLPFFVPEKGLEPLREELKSAIGRGVRRFRITSLFQFNLFPREAAGGGIGLKDEPFELTCSWPLPVTNSRTAGLLENMGATIVQGWIELDRPALEELLAASSLPVERFVKGRIPLLVSRASISVKGTIVDGRGRSFYLSNPVKKPYHPEGITILWSDGVFIDPDYDSSDQRSYYFEGNLLPGYDYPEPRAGEEDNRFNLDREWK